MEINIITAEDDRIKKVLRQIEQIKCQAKAIKENSHPLLYGERYLTDVTLSARLSISRRTLQQWRSDGKIGYIKLAGKCLYRESEIEKLLKENYYVRF